MWCEDAIGHSQARHSIQDRTIEHQFFELIINPASLQPVAEDGGAHWSLFNDSLTNLDIRALALTPGNPNTLYVATAGRVFKISDPDQPQSGTVTSVQPPVSA
jgi:hypothetical protein